MRVKVTFSKDLSEKMTKDLKDLGIENYQNE